MAKSSESNKLWGSRFAENSAEILEKFNASIGFDYKLYRHDKRTRPVFRSNAAFQDNVRLLVRAVHDNPEEINMSLEGISMLSEKHGNGIGYKPFFEIFGLGRRSIHDNQQMSTFAKSQRGKTKPSWILEENTDSIIKTIPADTIAMDIPYGENLYYYWGPDELRARSIQYSQPVTFGDDPLYKQYISSSRDITRREQLVVDSAKLLIADVDSNRAIKNSGTSFLNAAHNFNMQTEPFSAETSQKFADAVLDYATKIRRDFANGSPDSEITLPNDWENMWKR